MRLAKDQGSISRRHQALGQNVTLCHSHYQHGWEGEAKGLRERGHVERQRKEAIACFITSPPLFFSTERRLAGQAAFLPLHLVPTVDLDALRIEFIYFSRRHPSSWGRGRGRCCCCRC